MNRPDLCSACGQPAKVVRGNYHFREISLPNVVLQGVDLIECGHCGNVDPVIPRPSRLMRALALAVIRKPYRLRGEEARFLRKYLRMTGEEFSGLLHVDKTTLSKWENNDDPIGDQSDRLIRMLALGLGPGLKAKLEESVQRFPEIRDVRQAVRIDVNAETMEYRYT